MKVDAATQSIVFGYDLFTSRYSPAPKDLRGSGFHWRYLTQEEAASVGESLRLDKEADVESWWIRGAVTREMVQQSEGAGL